MDFDQLKRMAVLRVSGPWGEIDKTVSFCPCCFGDGLLKSTARAGCPCFPMAAGLSMIDGRAIARVSACYCFCRFPTRGTTRMVVLVLGFFPPPSPPSFSPVQGSPALVGLDVLIPRAPIKKQSECLKRAPGALSRISWVPTG